MLFLILTQQRFKYEVVVPTLHLEQSTIHFIKTFDSVTVTYVRTIGHRATPKAEGGHSNVPGTTPVMCTQDSCKAEVTFNTIMYYVSNEKQCEKQNSSLQYTYTTQD